MIEETKQTLSTERLSLPPLAFNELMHALKLAYVQSYGQGLDGQHLRTAIWQFLYHVERDSSADMEPFRGYCHEVSRAQARAVLP